MTTVCRIEMRELALPLKTPFVTSAGTMDVRRTILLRITDSDGHTGWAECVALEHADYVPETLASAWQTLEADLAGRLLGAGWEHPREVWPLLCDAGQENAMAIAGLEMAAWELAARAQNRSLADMLGAGRTRVPAGIALGVQDDPARAVERVRDCLARGYQRVKIKIMPGRDLEIIRAVRDALGGNAPLSVDANGAYSLSDTAPLEALDDMNLLMMEQPLANAELEAYADLQSRLRTPLCLDESVGSLEDLDRMIALDAARVLNLKPGRVGGFSVSLAMLERCARYGIGVWCGGMLESGVGRAHNVALSARDEFTMPGDLSPSERYWVQDIVSPEWQMNASGEIAVPRDRPGMGCLPEMELIDRVTVRSRVLQ